MADNALEVAKKIVQDGQRIVVFSGAGISTASGIPDFRGPEGVWTKNPAAEADSHIDEYLAKEDVRKRSWARLVTRVESEPNVAHRALAAFAETGRLYGIITQNTDGLHSLAGSLAVVELHGHTRSVRCRQCGERSITTDILVRVKNGEEDPRCATCGGVLATEIIRFGEALDQRSMNRAWEMAVGADVIVVIGSTLVVQPAASLVADGYYRGARVVVVNRDPTDMDGRAAAVVRDDISIAVPYIFS
jgi:NAD-dependent deacetylase